MEFSGVLSSINWGKLLKSTAKILVAILKSLARSTLRGLRLCIKPVSTFKDISENPELSGPVFFICLNLLLTLIQFEVLFSKVYQLRGEVLVKAVKWEETIHLLLAWRSFTLIMVWLALFAIMWFLMKLLGGQFESYSLFSALGYIYIIQLLLSLVDLSFMYVISNITPTLVIHSISEIKRELQVSLSMDILYEVFRQLYGNIWFIKRFYQWFFNLWSMLLYVSLARAIGNLDWIKASIVGVSSYAIVFFVFLILRMM